MVEIKDKPADLPGPIGLDVVVFEGQLAWPNQVCSFVIAASRIVSQLL